MALLMQNQQDLPNMSETSDSTIFRVEHVFKRPPAGNRETYILSDLTFEELPWVDLTQFKMHYPVLK